MDAFANQLKAEIAELKADLIANPDPRVRKIRRLEDALAEYEPVVTSQSLNGAANPFIREPAPEDPIAAGESNKTKSARMIEELTKRLRNNIVHRSDLLIHLTNKGIMGQEK